MENEVFLKEKKSKTGLIVFSIITLIIIAVGTFLLITQVFNKIEKNNNSNNGNNNQTVEEKEKITPLMYEITKEGSTNKIYLIGSIHFANLEKVEFPEYVINAYNNSNYIACEFDLVKTLANLDKDELMKDYFYTYPDSLDKHVSSESYDKILKFMNDKFKYTEEEVKTMSISYLDSIVTQLILAKSDINAQEGVDMYFLNKAHDENKNILEVESYEFQSNLEKSFPDRVGELSIIGAIDDFDESIKEINDLYTAWKKGDPTELEKLLLTSDTEGFSKEDIALMEDYSKKMLDDRNVGMKEKLEEYFDNNYSVFYMVGAAHLIGDNGIAKLVEQDGYTVKIVK